MRKADYVIPFVTIDSFVKNLSGNTLTLNAEPTDTISAIKSQVFERELVSVDEQRYVFGGKHIRDEFPLSEYGIQKVCLNNSTRKTRDIDLCEIICGETDWNSTRYLMRME